MTRGGYTVALSYYSSTHPALLGLGRFRLFFRRVVCNEHRHENRRCATVREMKEGPSGSMWMVKTFPHIPFERYADDGAPRRREEEVTV